MRKNIRNILQSNNFELKQEYSRLYNLFFLEAENEILNSAVCQIVDENFLALDKAFTGRCISLYDFDRTYGFIFVSDPVNVSTDFFVRFCEYIYNFSALVHPFCTGKSKDRAERIASNVLDCMSTLGYSEIVKDDISIFVEDMPEAVAVAEIVEDALAYKVLEYDHHRMRGDLEKKKATLKLLADNIESERPKIRNINKTLESQLYQLMNKFVRHDHSQTPYISKMTLEEIEAVYDDIYQLWLLAKLEIDNLERKKRVKNLLQQINGESLNKLMSEEIEV